MPKVLLFDTETTGFPKLPIESQPDDVQPKIIQLHASIVDYAPSGDYEVLETISTYVCGAVYVPKKITEITGIAMRDLVGAPLWTDVRESFFEMANSAGVVCAHNFEFDARMVQLEEQRLGMPKPFQSVKRRCTLKMSRRINTDAPSHNLGNLYKHLFGQELKDAHTAEADVGALIKVYIDLVKKGAWSKGNNPALHGAKHK